MKKHTIGFVIADSWEYEPFKKFAAKYNAVETKKRKNNVLSFTIDAEMKIVCVECGIGKVNAAIATSYLISEEKADTIINIGLSGAVDGVHRNDIVVGTQYQECDFDLTAIGVEAGVKPDQEYIYSADKKLLELAKECETDYFGKLGTGDMFLADSKLKKKFLELFSICSFDMETGAIAAVCHKYDTPFVCIRKISDDCDENAVENYRELNGKREVHLSEIAEQLLIKIAESDF